MHCVCCDALLSDYESTLRRKGSAEYTDMCNRCLKDVPIDTESKYVVAEERGLDEDEVYSTDFQLDLFDSYESDD